MAKLLEASPGAGEGTFHCLTSWTPQPLAWGAGVEDLDSQVTSNMKNQAGLREGERKSTLRVSTSSSQPGDRCLGPYILSPHNVLEHTALENRVFWLTERGYGILRG